MAGSSTALGPLKKAIKRAYGLAETIENETAGLVRVIDQAAFDAEEFEVELEKMETSARQLLQTIRLGHAKAAEMKEMPSAADKIAESQFIAEGLDSLLAGMPSYQLARELELVPMELYVMAFTELGSYEEGLARLTEIRDAAERVMLTRRLKI